MFGNSFQQRCLEEIEIEERVGEEREEKTIFVFEDVLVVAKRKTDAKLVKNSLTVKRKCLFAEISVEIRPISSKEEGLHEDGGIKNFPLFCSFSFLPFSFLLPFFCFCNLP